MSTNDDPLPLQYDGDRNYHEGDSWNIWFELVEEFPDGYEPWEEPEEPIPIDLTGASARFLAKESRTDRDDEALLEKTSTGDGRDDADTSGDIEIKDPPEDGRLVVNIRTDDTDGWLDGHDEETGEDIRHESKTFRWVLRVTDSEGNRVSSEVGQWEIHAS